MWYFLGWFLWWLEGDFLSGFEVESGWGDLVEGIEGEEDAVEELTNQNEDAGKCGETVFERIFASGSGWTGNRVLEVHGIRQVAKVVY